MKPKSQAILIPTLLSLPLFISDAHAYVGPGLGMGVIGAIIGIICAIFLAIVGVIWYPLKRFFKTRNTEKSI